VSWKWWRHRLVRHQREPRQSRPPVENARLVPLSHGNAAVPETCCRREADGRQGFPRPYRCIFVNLFTKRPWSAPKTGGAVPTAPRRGAACGREPEQGFRPPQKNNRRSVTRRTRGARARRRRALSRPVGAAADRPRRRRGRRPAGAGVRGAARAGAAGRGRRPRRGAGRRRQQKRARGKTRAADTVAVHYRPPTDPFQGPVLAPPCRRRRGHRPPAAAPTRGPCLRPPAGAVPPSPRSLATTQCRC